MALWIGKSRPAFVALTFLSSGCAWLGLESPVDRATRLERLQCDVPPRADDARLVASTRVLRVEGRYSMHTSGVSQLTGTRILLRPQEGVSAERMTRVLQCHTAQSYLQRSGAPSPADDPYSLPNAVLDIDVYTEQGNYVALVVANSIASNLQVLGRAKEFARDQRAAAPAAALP